MTKSSLHDLAEQHTACLQIHIISGNLESPFTIRSMVVRAAGARRKDVQRGARHGD